MNSKTFKEVLAVAIADGYKWAQFSSGNRIYFISLAKLASKIEDNDAYVPLLVQQQWQYLFILGAIRQEGTELGMSLHPFPVPEVVDPDMDIEYDYAG